MVPVPVSDEDTVVVGEDATAIEEPAKPEADEMQDSGIGIEEEGTAEPTEEAPEAAEEPTTTEDGAAGAAAVEEQAADTAIDGTPEVPPLEEEPAPVQDEPAPVEEEPAPAAAIVTAPTEPAAPPPKQLEDLAPPPTQEDLFGE